MMKPSAYPPLDGLVDLACRDGVDIRPTLLRVLTDLYVQKPTHSADEETQYVELALGLIEAVDAPTCAAVVASLSAYPAAPAVILRRLTGTVSNLSADDPIDPTQTKTETDDLVELFFAAGAEERRLILINLDVAGGATDRHGHLPPAASEVIRRLEAAALQRNTGEFSRMLERALGISRELAERIARDPSGEPIVVVARALGMTAAVLQRILLFLNPLIGESIERVYDLARLFDELTPEAAARMLAIWRKGAERSRPVHEPVHWDDEHRRARSLSTPAPHRVARGRDEQRSRFKTSGH
jgi:hypothetical protein